MVKFNCSHCSQRLEVGDEYLGMNLKCPSCSKDIIVPIQKKVEPPPLLDQSMDCSKCGNKIAAGKKFCVQCGTPLELTKANPIKAVGLSAPTVEQIVQWYYHDGSKQIGPIEERQLIQLIRSGGVRKNTQVWKVGSPSWSQAGSTELAQYLTAEPPPMMQALPPPIPPSSVGAGQDGMVMPRNPPRTPGWMAFWAAVWPGLGQLLCGQKTKGVVLMLASCFGSILTAGLLSIPFCIIGAIDAYKVADTLARGRPVKEWEFFPSP